jgi:hypothetical protein
MRIAGDRHVSPPADATDPARQLLAQAEAKWRELEANNPGNRAWHWPELTLCELVLEEARQQVGTSTVIAGP